MLIAGFSSMIAAAEPEDSLAPKACGQVLESELVKMDADQLSRALAEPVLVVLSDKRAAGSRARHRDWMPYFKFDGEDPTNPPDQARQDAQTALAHLLERLDFGAPAPFKRRTTRFRISLDKGGAPKRGVTSDVNHGFSYLTLLEGAKSWHLAPPWRPRPDSASCEEGTRPGNAPGATLVCEQTEGMTMVVPTGWWHTTCNWEGTTLGIGGEDDCDKVACEPPPTDPRRSHVCSDPRRWAACFGEYGEEARDRAVELAARHGGRKRERAMNMRLEQAIMTVRSVDPALWQAVQIEPPLEFDERSERNDDEEDEDEGGREL